MNDLRQRDLLHDLVLPTLLFVAIGGMVWAVRGCSGYGAMNGCIFAGVTWGTAWWFIARNAGRAQSRPYTSGWIVLALTIGIGFSGSRGWMQWPSFFEGYMQTDSPHGKSVPIDRMYGFIWLFIAGVPWAGLGACFLAWCSAERPSKDWPSAFGVGAMRVAFGIGGALIGLFLFSHLPGVFLPMYSSMKAQYQDLTANPNLRRLIGDNRLAIEHLGLYLGFLSCEIVLRRWRNVVLISTVGPVNGIGWSLLQNWSWAHHVWPNVQFNFWRCWESSGGLSIGLSYGLAYYLANRAPSSSGERPSRVYVNGLPVLERFGLAAGLIYGLGMSIKCGMKGWANIYLGNEDHWDKILWMFFGPGMLLGLLALSIWTAMQLSAKKNVAGDVFPRAAWIIWGVLITQNILAQMVTGPMGSGSETAFKVYYVILFIVSAAIVVHYQREKKRVAV